MKVRDLRLMDLAIPEGPNCRRVTACFA